MKKMTLGGTTLGGAPPAHSPNAPAAKRPPPRRRKLGRTVVESKRERRIVENASRFEIPTLIAVLESEGWKRDEIRFASNPSLVSQPGLVHAVEFIRDPRHVRILLNMGLLSAQSPLPSYFFQQMDDLSFDASEFHEFVGFLDHVALNEFVESVYPELNRSLFASWEQYKRRELQLLNLGSTATLHWLLSTAFPELRVQIRKTVVQHEIETGGLVLGSAILGDGSVLGRRTYVPLQANQVTLIAETERAASGKPWPAEVTERAEELVFPVLRSVGVVVEIILEVKSEETWAQLQTESYLGYDRVQGGENTPRRIRLFSA